MHIIETHTHTIGYFGKLPKFADFVKYNASGTEITMLDKWIQEGLSIAKLKYKNEWKSFYEGSPNLNFIFPFTGTDKIVIGIIKPSHDKSGRLFPFLFFVIINKSTLNNIPDHLVAMNYNFVFDALNNLIQSNFESETLDELKTRINIFSFPSSSENSFADSYKNYISSQTVQNFFGSSNDQQQLNDLVQTKLFYFENSAGVNFTFSSEPENEFLNLSFVTEMLINIFSKYSMKPALFWKRLSDETIVLNALFQQPSPSNFVEFIYSEKMIQEIQNNNLLTNTHNIFKDLTIVNSNVSLDKLLNLVRTSLK